MLGVWQSVLNEIEQKVPHASFSTWFKGVELLESGDEVIIGVPNIFYIKQLEIKYAGIISDALKNAGMEFRVISYVVHSDGKKKIRSREVINRGAPPAVRPTYSPPSNQSADNGLNSKYRFDNFVVGPNNDLAVSAAKAVVDNPGTRYNPYFLYGGSGLGKTHLIQAIGNELAEKNPRLKILYITIEQFYHDFVEAMRKNISGFAQKYRKVDVLIVDDFQLITGKEKSQEEFFHTFNELYQHNKQIIVSSDRLPSQIATVDERLASRLMAGIPIDLQLPDFEVRCAILKMKADLAGVEIENYAIEYISENVKTNIRELEGKFNQLVALSEMRGISPEEIINDGYLNNIGTTKIKAVLPKQVVEKTAKFFQLSAKDIMSESRAAHIKTPRQIAMYLLSEELGLSTPKIAVELGRKDHTTAMHSIKKIKNDLKLNFSLREQVAAIREKIYE